MPVPYLSFTLMTVQLYLYNPAYSTFLARYMIVIDYIDVTVVPRLL
jgi:hypothetical protein